MNAEAAEVERMLRAIFEAAAASLDERLALGEILHAGSDGRTTYARHDGDHSVITIRRGDENELQHRIPGDWRALR